MAGWTDRIEEMDSAYIRPRPPSTQAASIQHRSSMYSANDGEVVYPPVDPSRFSLAMPDRRMSQQSYSQQQASNHRQFPDRRNSANLQHRMSSQAGQYRGRPLSTASSSQTHANSLPSYMTHDQPSIPEEKEQRPPMPNRSPAMTGPAALDSLHSLSESVSTVASSQGPITPLSNMSSFGALGPQVADTSPPLRFISSSPTGSPIEQHAAFKLQVVNAQPDADEDSTTKYRAPSPFPANRGHDKQTSTDQQILRDSQWMGSLIQA